MNSWLLQKEILDISLKGQIGILMALLHNFNLMSIKELNILRVLLLDHRVLRIMRQKVGDAAKEQATIGKHRAQEATKKAGDRAYEKGQQAYDKVKEEL